VTGHQVCVQRLQGQSSPVRYLPIALLLPGTTLRGRVRDAEGKPLAGAVVRVEDPLTADSFTMCWFESATRSDHQGIFEVPGVPRTGLRVTVSAPGDPAESRLAAHDSPLDFTLTATGFVRGRVVDGDGKPITNAQVSAITVEAHRGAERVVSDAEGRFALTVPRSARFRVGAHEGQAPYRQFSSGLLHGPVDDLAVTTQAAACMRRIVLRCVDAASKAPLEQSAPRGKPSTASRSVWWSWAIRRHAWPIATKRTSMSAPTAATPRSARSSSTPRATASRSCPCPRTRANH
jgi:Carboxypeptidase regulatory-like domain